MTDVPSEEERPAADPATALVDCTAYQVDILLILADNGPQKGISIRRALGDRYEYTRNSRLYPNLDRLADSGLIEKSPAADGRAKLYRLTDAGRHQVAAYTEYVYTRGGEA